MVNAFPAPPEITTAIMRLTLEVLSKQRGDPLPFPDTEEELNALSRTFNEYLVQMRPQPRSGLLGLLKTARYDLIGQERFKRKEERLDRKPGRVAFDEFQMFARHKMMLKVTQGAVPEALLRALWCVLDHESVNQIPHDYVSRRHQPIDPGALLPVCILSARISHSTPRVCVWLRSTRRSSTL